MKQIHREALQEIEQSKIKALRQIEARKSELYEQIPRIHEIDNEIFNTGAKLARMLIKGAIQSEFEALKLNSANLEKERQKILSNNGYNSDYFVEPYSCKVCLDSGIINNSKCHCLNQKIIDKYYQMSNLSEIISIENFDTFNMEYYSSEIVSKYGRSPRANMEAIFSASLKFVESFGAKNKFSNLLFYGSTGLGKTFLSNCIAKEILDLGFSVIYVSSGQLFSILERHRFGKDSLDAVNYISTLMNAELLIIDDLGTEFTNKLVQSELFNILNTRILHKKSTIISTNIPLLELEEHYNRRIFSRIVGEFTSFNFIGRDIRLIKKTKSN